MPSKVNSGLFSHKGAEQKGPYLCPGFATHCLLLNEVALHPLPSIILWRFPGESAGSPGHVTYFQVPRWSGQICRPTKAKISTFKCFLLLINPTKFVLNFESSVFKSLVRGSHTEHGDPDFDHFVSSWALSVDDVSTAVAHSAFGDHHH